MIRHPWFNADLIGILMTCVAVGCTTSDPQPVVEGATPKIQSVDDARALDDAALLNARLRVGEVAWIADGNVRRADSLEQAIAIAANAPHAPWHGYLAVGGEEVARRWELPAPYPVPSVIGNEALAQLADEVSIDASDGFVTLTANGMKVTFPFKDDRPIVPFRVRSAVLPGATRELDILIATGFKDGLLLAPGAAVTVSLQTCEQPGATEVVNLSTNQTARCRHGLVYIEIPQLKTGAIVSAATPQFGEWR